MKNCIIVVLIVALFVSLFSINQMSSRASYWMNRCEAAENVIERVELDNENYVLDVLCESDAWYEWYEVYCPEM